jgi:CRP/FNR family transcriptional regulator, nitrogen fixation regulation protein
MKANDRFPLGTGAPALIAAARESDQLLAHLEPSATQRRCRRGERIYGPGDPTDHWYRVVSGVAGMCAPLGDGRRRIIDLSLPGDFFGFSARSSHGHAAHAVVAGTVVARYPRTRIQQLAQTQPAVAAALLDLAFGAISRLEGRVLCLASMTAQERVGSFLVDLAERASGGGPCDEAVLQMSRYDIADYLGLSPETVSRALTQLRASGAIALPDAHRVKILDRSALLQRQTAQHREPAPHREPAALPAQERERRS